jgi:hypothetical protein
MADDDLRDERLGAQLEVEPLDDVTRRRLVTTALHRARPRRTGRWIAAAAALLVVVVGGTALLVAPADNTGREAATPARTPEKPKSAAVPDTTAPASPAADAGRATSSAAAAPGAPAGLGDFGDLSSATNRDRVRQAVSGAASANQADRSFAAGAAATSALVAELAARGCTASLPPGTTTAVGTGTLDGARAIVVLTVRADGTRVIDTAVGDPCTVRPLS